MHLFLHSTFMTDSILCASVVYFRGTSSRRMSIQPPAIIQASGTWPVVFPGKICTSSSNPNTWFRTHIPISGRCQPCVPYQCLHVHRFGTLKAAREELMAYLNVFLHFSIRDVILKCLQGVETPLGRYSPALAPHKMAGFPRYTLFLHRLYPGQGSKLHVKCVAVQNPISRSISKLSDTAGKWSLKAPRSEGTHKALWMSGEDAFPF